MQEFLCANHAQAGTALEVGLHFKADKKDDPMKEAASLFSSELRKILDDVKKQGNSRRFFRLLASTSSVFCSIL